jgi:hypothetical protein
LIETLLQRALGEIYRIELTASVQDFRINGEILEAVLGAGAMGVHRETLVVLDQGEHADVALYIADEVVDRARTFVAGLAGPLEHLDEFCVATEGVSHFVYLLFCGEQQDRPVSQIELELQAEIDKFVVLRALSPLAGHHLLERLYDRFHLAERLSAEERERYRVANQHGRRYARWLDREFTRGRGAAALADARRLYRKPLSAKLEHIDRAA